MATAQEEVLDVIVIGGGWSGLMACKYAKEENLSVRVLEKREDIGGVWKYSPDPEITTVMKSSCTTSSSTITEISDFPMPESIGNFPKHLDVFEYLESYVDKFSLRQHIRFNCCVKSMEKQGKTWSILTEDKVEYRAKNVIICSGVYEKTNISLEKTVLRGFNGEVVHSVSIKEFQERHRNKRIMLIGGGETASDILDEYHDSAESVIWCIPHGQQFFRKVGKLLPHHTPQPLDRASSRALHLVAPMCKDKPGMSWICKWTTSGSMTAYQGHGMVEFRTNAKYLHHIVNKHAHVLDYIDYKKVVPKGEIDFISGQTVHFKDGTSHDVDVIIQCTGYEVSFPFLPLKYANTNLTNLYKYVYNVEDPTLSFVGYVRPVVGSIPVIAEIQARWVCRIMSGRLTLVNHDKRVNAVKEDKVFWQDYFKDSSQRANTLVDLSTYADQVARLSNCYPDYWNLFKENPRSFFTSYFAPFNGSSYQLNDPEKKEEALRTLQRHSTHTATVSNLLFVLFMRLIMFDWFCNILEKVKYKIQINKYWHLIRDWKLIRFFDYIWCTPKRIFFDNCSRS